MANLSPSKHLQQEVCDLDVDQTTNDRGFEFEFGGDFGDFCLMCGEMIQIPDNGGHRLRSAYCSHECEVRDEATSNTSAIWWGNPADEMTHLAMSGCSSFQGSSTEASSVGTSPPYSPSPSVSDRLAILCSGPPPCESLPPIDLGERLLGAAAVERYLTERKLVIDSLAEEDDHNDAWHANRPAAVLSHLNFSLKASPATAALTDPMSLLGLPDHLLIHDHNLPRAPSLAHIAPRRATSFIDPRSISIETVRPARRVSQPLPPVSRLAVQSVPQTPGSEVKRLQGVHLPSTFLSSSQSGHKSSKPTDKPRQIPIIRCPSSPEIPGPASSPPLRSTYESYAFYL